MKLSRLHERLHGAIWAFALSAGLGTAAAASASEAGDEGRSLVDFARQIGATQDVAARIEDVLEPQALAGACERHFARLEPATQKLSTASRHDPEHVRDMVRCGKWLFFAADFSSKMAIPETILRATPELFPDDAGPVFSRTGLYENPFEKGIPIGFVRLATSPWGVLSPATGPARGIACATCHFGQLPDGRYASGMPNQQLDFGKLNALLVYSAWRADFRKFDGSIWPTRLQNYYQSLDVKLRDAVTPARALFDVATLISWVRASDSFYTFTGASRPLKEEAATWLSGTPNQYYASSPLLPVTGKSYWMAAPAVWDMKNYPGEFELGHTRPLSSFSPTKTAEDFVGLAYIFQTGESMYAQPKYVDPLVLYFRSMKTPENKHKPERLVVERGRELFTSHCQSCHNGVDGETLQAHSAAALGTPLVLVDPLLNYVAPKKLSASIYTQTVTMLGYQPLTNDGIYGRPLKGIYARRHIMLNGSVPDLSAAFCLDHTRGEPSGKPDGLRDDVHMDLCHYEEADRRDLKGYLEAWD